MTVVPLPIIEDTEYQSHLISNLPEMSIVQSKIAYISESVSANLQNASAKDLGSLFRQTGGDINVSGSRCDPKQNCGLFLIHFLHNLLAKVSSKIILAILHFLSSRPFNFVTGCVIEMGKGSYERLSNGCNG